MKTTFYIGLDVHKAFTYYAVRDINGAIALEGKSSSIGKDLYEILEPYLHSCIIGLETNTEIYPIYEYFKEKSFDIRAGNTIQLRTLIGKNDRLDAKRLSDMLRLGSFLAKSAASMMSISIIGVPKGTANKALQRKY